MTATAPRPPAAVQGPIEIHTTRKALAAALDQLARVIPTRSSNPALTAVRIDVTPETLILSGTNLETDLQLTVPVEARGHAAFVVPGHLLHAVVGKLPGELVTLELSGRTLHIHSGGSLSKIQTGDIDTYPPLTFADGEGLPVESAPLADAVRAIRHLLPTESYQIVLRGLKVELHTGRTRLVASDSYAVLYVDLPALGVARDQDLLIPGRSLDVLLSALSSAASSTLRVSDHVLAIEAGRTRANLKLLDGDFPTYERVFPKIEAATVMLPAATLAESIDRVRVFADRNANNRLELTITSGRLRLTADGDYGGGDETLEVVTGGAQADLRVATNAELLRDLLKPMSGDVRLAFSGPTSPVVMTCSGNADLHACGVVLKL